MSKETEKKRKKNIPKIIIWGSKFLLFLLYTIFEHKTDNLHLQMTILNVEFTYLLATRLLCQGYQKTKLVSTLKKFYGRHHDLVHPYNVAVSRNIYDVLSQTSHTQTFKILDILFSQLFILPSFGLMGMVGETCLPSKDYFPRVPDYRLLS